MKTIKNVEIDGVLKKGLFCFFFLLCVVCGGVAVLGIHKYVIKKDLESRNIVVIWAQMEHVGDDEYTYVTNLYRCKFGEPEELLEDRYELFDFILSRDNRKLLTFVGHRTRFDIAEYDLEKKELKIILSSAQVDEFLDKNNYEKPKIKREGRCVRYYDDGKKISFRYGKYLIGYSEQTGLEVICVLDSAGELYSWMENNKVLLINKGTELVKLNPVTGEHVKWIKQADTLDFVVSEDENFVVFEDSNYSFLWKHDLESGKRKKICRCSHPGAILRISDDGRYLLCRDALDILSSVRTSMYIVDIKSGKKVKLKSWGFDKSVKGMAWNQ